jgi:DCC1-like thiol-disulfide oxidoreductase
MVERMSTLPQLAPPRVPSTSPDGQPTVNAASGADFFTAADSRPVILYDGDCNLCNGGVQFMLDWDKEGLFRLAALQSEAGKALLLRSGREPGEY